MKHYLVALAMFAFTTTAVAADITAEQDAALRAIEEFSLQQRKSDPFYPAIEAELLKRLDELIRENPPSQWANLIRRWYFASSLAMRNAELSRVRVEEREAAAGISAPDPRAPDRFVERLQQLEQDLSAGKLSPREHAIHALESARLIFPEDRILISLRQEKVAIATAYELGAFGPDEYDRRWEDAKARYQQRADARVRGIMTEMQAVEAARPSIGRAIGDAFRQQRGITCTPNPYPPGSISCR